MADGLLEAVRGLWLAHPSSVKPLLLLLLLLAPSIRITLGERGSRVIN
tara:strand:- start:1038 stop:1181 length:144 start_codon:yes stop_codon:yes gene_type:complete